MTLLGLVGVGRIGAFHARTLHGLPDVEVVVADAQSGRAEQLAATLGLRWAPDIGSLLCMDLEALVVATPTGSHAELTERGVAAGIPVFCEKPVAENSAKTLEVIKTVEKYGGRVQIGFQRRFDTGYAAVRAEVHSGALGRVHTLRGQTSDPFPPPAGYIATSGGIFRDCSVHDFDTVRWVSGQEVVEVYATGSARGDAFFAEFGDVATAHTLLTFDDGATAVVSNTRYNARGYDVRLELHGTDDSVTAGWSDTTPLRNLEPGVSWPAGPPATFFMDRLTAAFRAELQAFTEVVAGQRPSPCTVDDALAVTWIAEAATLSLQQHRPVQTAEVQP